MTGIITATITVAALGLLTGIFLGVAGKRFAVEVDEREAQVLKALPGNNCGGCGFAGCSGLAAAIAKGEADVGACPVGGAQVAGVIGRIMGVKAAEGARKTAFVKCGGDCSSAKTSYEYSGLISCRMQKNAPGGGEKACSYGCLGGGDCVRACPFDAITIENGIAVVSEERCKACGKCVAACPRGIIELVRADLGARVCCSSKDKGAVALKCCTVACIGCSLCKKACGFDAITIEDNLARIDYDKCTGCGSCAEKCPKKAIRI